MAVAEDAKRLDCRRLSWVAEKDNVEARRLYDSLATCEYVQYRMPL